MLKNVTRMTEDQMPADLQKRMAASPLSTTGKLLGQFLFQIALLEETGDLSPRAAEVFLTTANELLTSTGIDGNLTIAFARLIEEAQIRLTPALDAVPSGPLQ